MCCTSGFEKGVQVSMGVYKLCGLLCLQPYLMKGHGSNCTDNWFNGSCGSVWLLDRIGLYSMGFGSNIIQYSNRVLFKNLKTNVQPE
jgi:hypothetical protein